MSSVNKILEIELPKPDHFQEDRHQKLALCKFWQYWSANFCFCQREPELPRFFILYHNSIRAELYQGAYFNLILYIPKPILSL